MSKNERIVNVFLNLFKPKLKVGTLAYKNEKIFFEYDDKFLKSTLELSPYRLPLKEGVFECNDGTFEGLWGLFNDSIPNGLEQLLIYQFLEKKNIKLLDITPLDRLCYIGNFTMGALSYEPIHKGNNVDIISKNLNLLTHDVLIKNNKENLIELFSSNSYSSPAIDYKVPIQHHRNKKSIRPFSKPPDQDHLQIFVKFISPRESKESGAIEYAYSIMAKDAKLERPKAYLLKNKYFGYTRYDHKKNRQLHMHSISGLLHDDINNPSLDYDDLLALCLDLTKDVREQEKLFRVACFNLFGSNRDDHTKNFSFSMDKDGVWKLAPSYNITFSNGLNGEHYTKYFGEGKNPTEKHLIELGSKHMIKKYKEIIAEVKTSISNWFMFADKANLSDETSKKIFSELSKRLNSNTFIS